MSKRGFLCLISSIVFLLPSFLLAGTATVEWQASPDSDLKEYRVYHGTASRIYDAALPVGTTTSYTFNGLADGVTHYFAVTAVDTDNNESGFSPEGTKYVSVSDTQTPQVTIVSPTANASYETATPTIALSGTALDDIGVTRVSWYSSRGGSGLASGTTNWSIPAIGLSDGVTTINVTGEDSAGNQGTAVISVTYNAPVVADNESPQVVIELPTASATFSTTFTIMKLAGTASDNVGVKQVSWENSGGGSGLATGTNSWSTKPIKLSSGKNTITITAVDEAGNQGTASITVNCEK